MSAMADLLQKPGIVLAKVPIFSGLTETELGFLTQRTMPRHYSAGEMVFGEGEPCSGLYVVESGQRPHLQELAQRTRTSSQH